MCIIGGLRMEPKKPKIVPEIKGILRSHVIEVPSCIRDCSGIKIFGKSTVGSLFKKPAKIWRI